MQFLTYKEQVYSEVFRLAAHYGGVHIPSTKDWKFKTHEQVKSLKASIKYREVPVVVYEHDNGNCIMIEFSVVENLLPGE